MSITTQRQIVEALVPEAQIDDITFETGDAEGRVVISLRFSIFDSPEDSAVSRYFAESLFRDTFKINVALWAPTDNCSAGYINEDGVCTPASVDLSIEDAIGPGISVLLEDGSTATKYSFSKTFTTTRVPQRHGPTLWFEITPKFDLTPLGIDLDIFSEIDSEESPVFPTKRIDIYKRGRLVYPIQDFRITNTTAPYVLPDEAIVGAYASRYQEASNRLDQTKRDKAAFVSDFWITRGAQGTAKFMFFFDAESYFMNRSEHRHYFRAMDPDLRGTVIRNLQVPSMRVVRKRVEIIEDLHGRRVVDYKDQSQTAIVVETSKVKGSNRFATVSTNDAAVKQVDISISGTRTDFLVPSRLRNLPGISRPLTKTDMFFLTGTDYQVSDITDGFYAYGVEVTVVDTMVETLLDELSKAKHILEQWKEIYNIMTLPENYDPVTGTLKRPMQEIRGWRRQPHVESLKPLMKVFAPTYDWRIESMTNFFNIFTDPNRVIQPNAVKTLIDVVDALISSALFDMGESEARLNQHHSISTHGATALPPALLNRDKTIRFYMSPEKLFDSNIPKRTGLDYLADFSEHASEQTLREIASLSEESGQVGLKVIDGARYQARLTAEIERHFPSSLSSALPPFPTSQPQTPSGMQGPGSEYLTLTRTLNQGSVIERNFTDPGSLSHSEVMRENVFNMGTPARLDFPPALTSREASYLSSYNVVFGDLTAKTLLMEDEASPSFSSRTSESPSTDDPYEPTPLSEAGQGNFEKYIFSKLQGVMNYPSLGTEKTFRSTQFPPENGPPLSAQAQDESTVWLEDVTESDQINRWTHAPNLIKYLAGTPRQATTDYYQVSLDFLTRVDYLKGFARNSSGSLNPLSPLWEPLTLQTYADNKAKNLLCRVKPVSIPSLGIRTTATGKPIFDSVFIIKPVDNPMVDTPDYGQLVDRTEASRSTGIELGFEFHVASIRQRIEEEELRIVDRIREYQTFRAEYVLHQEIIRDIGFQRRLSDHEKSLRVASATQQSTRLRESIQRNLASIDSSVSTIKYWRRELLEIMGETN